MKDVHKVGESIFIDGMSENICGSLLPLVTMPKESNLFYEV